MNKPETMMIDEVKYIRADSIKQQPETTGAIRIVILQRGWVMIGRFTKDGPQCRLENASVVRIWGTSKGLGELATKGPLPNTKLDPCPPVEFHELTIVQTMECVEEVWVSKLI